jgi:hypothetical protein
MEAVAVEEELLVLLQIKELVAVVEAHLALVKTPHYPMLVMVELE